jgi:hypothetical protein
MNWIFSRKTGGAVCLDVGEVETLETEFPPSGDNGVLMAHITIRLQSGCVYLIGIKEYALRLWGRAPFQLQTDGQTLELDREPQDDAPLPMTGVSTCVVEGQKVPIDCADPRIICAILRWGLLFRKARHDVNVDRKTAEKTLSDIPSHSQAIQWLIDREFPYPFLSDSEAARKSYEDRAWARYVLEGDETPPVRR